MANGFVPVGIACNGSGCWGVGACVWKGEFAVVDVGDAKVCIAGGDVRANGLVACLCRGCGFGGNDCTGGEAGCPVIWPVMSMDWRNGLVVCCGVCSVWKPVGEAVWKLAGVACCIGEREVGWKPGWGEKPPKPAPVKFGCNC